MVVCHKLAHTQSLCISFNICFLVVHGFLRRPNLCLLAWPCQPPSICFNRLDVVCTTQVYAKSVKPIPKTYSISNDWNRLAVTIVVNELLEDVVWAAFCEPVPIYNISYFESAVFGNAFERKFFELATWTAGLLSHSFLHLRCSRGCNTTAGISCSRCAPKPP